VGKRLTPAQRKYYYDELAKRDGDECRWCHRPPDRLRGLEIHHVNGDHGDWAWSNLALLCKYDNLAERNRRNRGPKSLPGAQLRERERDREVEAQLEVNIHWPDATPEVQSSRIFEKRFLSWLTLYVETHGSITLTNAQNWGAQKARCSVLTTKRYLQKLGTPYDQFVRSIDDNGEVVLTLDAEFTVSEEHGTGTIWNPAVNGHK